MPIVLTTFAFALGAQQALTPETVAKRTQTLSNAKQVAVACLMYQADADDRFPWASSTAEAKRVTLPYLKDLKIWRTMNPAGGDLAYNTRLAGVLAQEIDRPAEVPLVHETKPWADGARVVAYTDGHAKVEAGARWPAIQKQLARKFKH